MQVKVPTLKVTALERDFLLQERLAAMHQCPDLEYQRARRDPKLFWAWTSDLQVLRRDKDGSLLARIVIAKRESTKRYIRKIRCHHSLGSSTERGLRLRRISNSG